jgi:exodeoxyribonuclease VII large subunit
MGWARGGSRRVLNRLAFFAGCRVCSARIAAMPARTPAPYCDPGDDLAGQARVISVSELNRTARTLIERQLPLLWVAGELSNFRRYDSGHCYFVLKDAQAQVRCVMFRGRAQHLDWKPADGAQVEVRAVPTLYEARGDFQLNVESMRQAGSGALYEAFARLKSRLEAEGLFDSARKRPLPRFPRCIGIVTSLQAAALRDVLTTLGRRMPGLPVVIYPTLVQGEGAAAQIAAAIETAGRRAECDVLLVCRGGGSIEDLWAFNEEPVARAIAASPMPVVSGVGHETDFTIADFAADLRAPTPTAAAELISQSRVELQAQLAQLARGLARAARRRLERHMQGLDYLMRRLVHPGERIAEQRRNLEHLVARLMAAMGHAAETWQWRVRELAREWRALKPDFAAAAERQRDLMLRLQRAARVRADTAAAQLKSLEAQLAQLNPENVLGRGYAIVRTANGEVVRDADRLAVGDAVDLTLGRGEATATVTGRKSRSQ